MRSTPRLTEERANGYPDADQPIDLHNILNGHCTTPYLEASEGGVIDHVTQRVENFLLEEKKSSGFEEFDSADFF